MTDAAVAEHNGVEHAKSINGDATKEPMNGAETEIQAGISNGSHSDSNAVAKSELAENDGTTATTALASTAESEPESSEDVDSTAKTFASEQNDDITDSNDDNVTTTSDAQPDGTIHNNKLKSNKTELTSNGAVKPVVHTPPNGATNGSKESNDTITQLRAQLKESQARVMALESASMNGHDSNDMLTMLQEKLEQQMSLKAEAENKCRILATKLQTFQEKEFSSSQSTKDMEELLQHQMNAKAEAEQKLRSCEKDCKESQEQLARVNAELEKLKAMEETVQEQSNAKNDLQEKLKAAQSRNDELEALNAAHTEDINNLTSQLTNYEEQLRSLSEVENNAQMAFERVQELENAKEEQATLLETMQEDLNMMREEYDRREKEFYKIKDERDEQQRKELALTNRLNAAKKNEADKVNAAESYETEIKRLEKELDKVTKELQEVSHGKEKVESVKRENEKILQERLNTAESLLSDERRLNEDRKQKMKAFVEHKSEELRQAKSDAETFQAELNQTSRSLTELNGRWKQLHAQWVQSQTRNRELQRDLNKLKKDSENWHKMGGTLEMKLSKSATETEEHKNKRMAAKHELMSVLRKLEVEREILNKLKDSVKFTFTPKALSQQQLLHDSLDDFEAQLMRLSNRLRKPLPPAPEDGIDDTLDNDIDVSGSTSDEDSSRIDAEMQRLVSKLDVETQSVSKNILQLSNCIERMRSLLDASDDRTCFSLFSDLVGSSQATGEAAGQEERAKTRPLNAIRSTQYSRV